MSVFFNTISILTGTGYVSAEFDGWGSFPLTLFLALMFIGGCAQDQLHVELKYLEFKFYIFYIKSN